MLFITFGKRSVSAPAPMPPQVPREEPRVNVVAATDAIADVELDRCVRCRNPGPRRSPPARRVRGRSSMPASCVSSARHNATMIIDFDSHLREGYFMDE